MSKGYDLFISYRRADAGGHAGRLYDRLRHWFDDEVIFYDLEAIDMGEVFPERIATAISTASAVLVVIGPDWLTEINRRVDRPGIDFVLREIELTLARSGYDNPPKIVPVLVGGALMPDPNQLHPSLHSSLAPLCSLDAHTFQGKQADWDQQFVRLRECLARVPGMPKPRFRAPAGVERPFRLTGDSLSPHFQDPNTLLGRLRQQLTSSQRATLCGMGGVGKTQMAVKYCLEYRDAYAGVWWFRAENDTTLQLDAQAACQTVGAPSEPGETPSTALNRWLDRQKDTWLLVYDNAEDAAALRPHLPRSGPHHLLITSRSPAWSGLTRPVEVDIWTPEQSADFLTSRLPGTTHADLPQLAQDLDGLPLALEQACGYIEETGCTVAEYLTFLSAIDTEGLILDEGRAATGYERTVAATLTLAFEKLNPAAQQLLRLCAYAAPEPLPERFFKEAKEQLPDELAEAASHPLQWNRVVTELRRYGLIKRHELPTLDRNGPPETDHTEHALGLHRLTQQAIRSRFSNPAKDCRTLLHLLQVCCPANANLPEEWPRYAVLTPHVTQLDRYLPTGWLDNRLFTWLLNQLSTYLLMGPALYAASAHWLQKALNINRLDLGEEHPDTLISMHNLAATLSYQGDLNGAQALLEKVLEVSTRVLGEEHPCTLTTMNFLTETRRSLDDLSGVRALQEKVLDIRQRILGEEHPDTLTTMNNLAATLNYQGDLKGAQVLHEKILAIQQRILGEEHPNTLTTMNNLAATLSSQGDLASARILHEKVLDIRQRILGDEHPNTLTSMNNLADTLHSQGDLTGARELQEKVLDIQPRVLGEEHPNTLTTMNNLAATLSSQGDLAGARALHEKVLEVRRRVLSDEHPVILTSMNNLADTLHRQGDLNGARALHEKVLEVSTRILGEDHPDTSLSAWNLYCTLEELNEADDAHSLLHTHLLWLLDRDPHVLGADQRQIREQLTQIIQRNIE